MHFGFWEKDTKNRQEAILNENKEVIRYGAIRTGMRILDAGCGVGGTAIYIAQTTGADVWGISLDPKQIELAIHYARKRPLTSPLTHFSAQDYMKTSFPDNYFDVVYGIESICYAEPKSSFFREAYRILKPGGKLILLDGYLAIKPKTEKERQVVKKFCWAFALPSMVTNEEMMTTMKKEGFIQTHSINKLKEVIPSVKYYRTWGILTKPFCILSQYIPLQPIQAIYHNYLACSTAAEGYLMGIGSYWLQYGQKPSKNDK